MSTQDKKKRRGAAAKTNKERAAETIEAEVDDEVLLANLKRNKTAEHQLNLQMELFQTVDPIRPEVDQRYSNTVDLYDSLPKYEWDSTEAKVPERVVRYREINGQRYRVSVTPASIERDGKIHRVYPGIREKIVEDALRKFVAAGQYTLHGGEVGVKFTVNQLCNELASLNHTYSRQEIREAIEVCGRSTLEVETQDGKRLIMSSFFPATMVPDKNEWLKSGGEARCFVRFNPLVTTSIVNDSRRS